MISRPACVLWVGIILTLVLADAVLASEPRSECSDVMAWLRVRDTNLTWSTAYPGLHLELGDAFVTCAGAQMTVRAECWLPFSRRIEGDPDVHRVGPNTMIRVVPRARRPGGASVAVDGLDVLDVVGTVLYAKDSEIVTSVRFPLAFRVGEGGSPADAGAHHAFERFRRAIKGLPGRPAVVGEQIEPWDVIRTGPAGRIEIDAPRGRLRDGTFSVVDAAGHLTTRMRFLEWAFFVMHPRFFPAAKVLAVRGEVVLIRTAEQIKALVGARGIVFGRLGFSDDSYEARWQAVLRQPGLEE